MNPANRQFLEDNRDCYYEVINADTALKAYRIFGQLLRIMREEFFPEYHYKGECGDCLFTLVRSLYSEFDKWVSANPKIINEEPLLVAASFPVNEPPPLAEKRKRK